ncbi:hypothetical protein [Alloactinosynnema sp. L-07]|uniref:hypothetical protein n=1 Tax=Alloactinosynnema sp. L-07 TaxID=1653480 RepID=UPI00065F0714|nr:hypothetical protein [Alloactinosynnema sp. L-07]CRK59189.1 hypothetical protein [Alloactinosynnema sp. L-07]
MTIAVTLINALRTRGDKLLQWQRDAYAEALSAIAMVGRVKTLDDLTESGKRVFAAQVQMHMMGKAAQRPFDQYASVVNELIEAFKVEAPRRSFKSVPRRVAETYPPEKREALAAAHREFIDAARRDLGIGKIKRQGGRLFRRS